MLFAKLQNSKKGTAQENMSKKSRDLISCLKLRWLLPPVAVDTDHRLTQRQRTVDGDQLINTTAVNEPESQLAQHWETLPSTGRGQPL